MKYFAVICILLMCAARCSAAAPATQSSKLWVDDFPAFMNQHSQKSWIVGVSRQPELSTDEAGSAAEADAADQLAGRLDPHLLHRFAPGIVHARLAASLKQNDWIVDRQITSAVRPYATLWHSAILIEAAPAKLELFQQQLQSELNHQRHRNVAASVLTFGLLATVSFFYVMLNWLTRGFCRLRLISISMLLVAAGVVGIMQLL